MLITAQIKSFHRVQWKLFPPLHHRTTHATCSINVLIAVCSLLRIFNSPVFSLRLPAFRPSLSIQRHVLILPRLFRLFLTPLVRNLLESPKLFKSIKFICENWSCNCIWIGGTWWNKYWEFFKLGEFFSQKEIRLSQCQFRNAINVGCWWWFVGYFWERDRCRKVFIRSVY